MIKDWTQKFEDVPATSLHYVYGAGCYPHARGYPYAILLRKQHEQDPTLVSLTYAKIQPGGFKGQPANATLEALQEDTFNRCTADGLIDYENRFTQKPGHRTLALFYANFVKPDFHFAFYNQEGLWETKTPFGTISKHPDLTGVEQSHEFDRYVFNRYLLAPENVEPKAISELQLRPLTIQTANGVIQLMETDQLPEEAKGWEITLAPDRPERTATFKTILCSFRIPAPPLPATNEVFTHFAATEILEPTRGMILPTLPEQQLAND